MNKYLYFLIFCVTTSCNSRTITNAPQPIQWPNIKENLFYKNLNNNLTHTLYLNQGSATNFCGFAIVTYHLIKSKPEAYKRMMLELYENGSTITPGGTQLTASDEIRKYAGTIKNKGVMDINHADQLWFLTLADNYKGYLNIIDRIYNPGDENKVWASTNLRKFNKMWSSLIGQPVKGRGSDLIRPLISNYYNRIKKLQEDHTVMLYLNSRILFKANHASFDMPMPTHFVELYELHPIDDDYVLMYWDYGLKTKVHINKRKFKKIIYGISYTSKKSTSTNELTND